MPEAEDPEHFEVLVVGGGPGGSAAATRLAEEGVEVCMIEKRQVVGNPAQCGECIPGWGEMTEAFPLMKDDPWLESYWEFPDHILAQYLGWMRVFSPKMREYSFELDCYGAHRLQFDGHLADRAVTAGVDLRIGHELRKVQKQPKLDREVYRTNQGSFTADHVIDASGSLAHIARLRGTGERPKTQLPTLYCQVEGHQTDSFDIFLGNIAPGGYAWIIPKGDIANVGIGIKHSKIDRPLKQWLDGFCNNLGLTPLSYGGGWIPIGGKVRKCVTDNVLAVGDAASLVMPSNGGGIGQAIVSGKMAADAILANREQGTSLEMYDDSLNRMMRKQLRISTRTKGMFWHLCRNDFITEVGLRILGTNGVRRAVDCRRPFLFL